MSRLITYLSRHATVLLAVGVLTGLVLPDMARVMRPALGPAIWGLLFVALLWVDVASVLNHVRRPVVLAAAVVWMLIVAPVLAWLVMLAVDLAPGIETAVVMMAGSSPITSAPALAMLIGLDGALGLLAMLTATMIMPFVLPLIALWLLDLTLAIEPWEFCLRLGLFVISAIAAAALARWLLGPRRLAKQGEASDLTTVVLLLIFAVAIMDGVTARLLAEPAFVLGTIALAFAGFIVLLFAGGLAMRPWGRDSARTIAYINANRNLAVFLAVLPADIEHI